jgi:hypothetical protein
MAWRKRRQQSDLGIEQAFAISAKVEVSVMEKLLAILKRWMAVTLIHELGWRIKSSVLVPGNEHDGVQTGGIRDSTGPIIKAVSSSVASKIASREARISGGKKSFRGQEISNDGVAKSFSARYASTLVVCSWIVADS